MLFGCLCEYMIADGRMMNPRGEKELHDIPDQNDYFTDLFNIYKVKFDNVILSEDLKITTLNHRV